MEIISSTHYASEMNEKVLPYLQERRAEGNFEAVPGQEICYTHYRADAPKATVVMVHGSTEGVEKFREMVWYFLREGFSVWQIEQRGHGYSYKTVTDHSLVQIEHYRDLIRDLRYFTKKIVKKDPESAGMPLYLYGHSMGGGVSACYLERYPDDYSKAVLSSPMLELDSGNIPVWAMSAFAKLMITLGKGASYLPGAVPYQKEPDFEHSCSNCPERYSWYHEFTNENPQYQTCAVSLQSALEYLRITQEAVREANVGKIRADILLCQAGKDDVVKPAGQEKFIALLKDRGRLVRFEDAKHEIYMGKDEDINRYLREIFAFFDK